MDGAGRTTAAALAIAWIFAAGCDAQPGVATPTTIATGAGSPGCLAADFDYLYWVSAGSPGDGGTVLRVDRAGGSPTVLARKQADPFAVAYAGATVYWVNRGTGLGDGALMKIAKTGGAAVSVLTRQTAAFDLRFDDAIGPEGSLLWTAPEEVDAGKRVKRLALDSGVLDDSIAVSQQRPYGLAAGTTAVYWTDVDAGTISRYDSQSNISAEIASGQTRPTGIAVADGFVYWTNVGRPETGVRGEVQRLDASTMGGTPFTIAAEQNVGGRGRIAVGNRRVYWFNVEGASHTLMSVPTEGGQPTKVAIGPGTDVIDLVIYDGWIYWTVAGQFDGSVLAIEEP